MVREIGVKVDALVVRGKLVQGTVTLVRSS